MHVYNHTNRYFTVRISKLSRTANPLLGNTPAPVYMYARHSNDTSSPSILRAPPSVSIRHCTLTDQTQKQY
jgi:hypothetical protein